MTTQTVFTFDNGDTYRSSDALLNSTSYSGYVGGGNLVSVVCGTSATEIDSNFVVNLPLTSVTLSDTVKSINPSAFVFCVVTNLHLGNGVEHISSSAFFGNGATIADVTIPTSTTYVGSGAFPTNITTFTVNNGLSRIYIDTPCSKNVDYFSLNRRTVFDNRFNFERINTLYLNTPVIGQYAFGYRINNLIFTNKVNVLEDSVFGFGDVRGSVVIPDSIVSMGNSQFDNDRQITSFAIGNGISGSLTMNNLVGVTSLTIGTAVTNISGYGWDNLQSVTFLGTKTPEYGLSILNNDVPVVAYYISGANITSIGSFLVKTPIEGKQFITINNLIYLITAGSNNAPIVGFSSPPDNWTPTIPSTITNNGTEYNVTIIDANAFSNCTELSAITIPSNINSIGINVFNGASNLKTITIPNSVTSLGVNAFNNCTQLSSVTIGTGITFIDSFVFSNCTSLTNVIVPNNITSIGFSTFNNCGNLLSITIGTGVTYIEDSAFNGCGSLISVYFLGTTMPSIYSNNNFGVNGSTAFVEDNANNPSSLLPFFTNVYYSAIVSHVKYGYSVVAGTTATTVVGYDSSAPNNWNLIIPTTITLSSQIYYVTSIGNYAFADTTKLTALTIPNSVTSIGSSIVGTSLNTLTISQSVDNTTLTLNNDSFPHVIGRLFQYRSTSRAISTTNLTYDYVNDINYNGYTELTSITIGNNVTSIIDNAFNSSTLNTLTIHSGIANIGDNAFNNVSNLTILNNGSYNAPPLNITANTFSGTATNLTQYRSTTNPIRTITLFYDYINDMYSSNISSLTSVTIGTHVTSVIGNAFNGCPINILTLNGDDSTLTTIGDYAFNNAYLSSLTLPNSLTSIGEYAFANSNINTLTVPYNISSIGSQAFNVANLTILNNDTFTAPPLTIASNTFSTATNLTQYRSTTNPISTITLTYNFINDMYCNNMSSLTSVTIGTNVTSVIDNAFNGCPITSLTINSSSTLKTIGDYAFNNATLTTLTLPSIITSIGNYAFYSSQLTSLTLYSNLTIIGNYAFYTSLITTLTVPNSVTSIGNYTFYSSPLTTLTLSINLTSIGEYAFYSSMLNTLTIPNNVTSIGNYTFYSSPLTTLTLSNTLTSINDYTFSSSNINTLTIPVSITSIGADVFNNINTLTLTYSETPLQFNDSVVDNIGTFNLNRDCTGTCQSGITNLIVNTNTIADNFFKQGKAIQNVSFNKINYIGNGAFYASGNSDNNTTYNWGDIHFPSSLTYIGVDAFRQLGYSYIQSLNFTGCNGCVIGDNAFRDSSNKLTSLILNDVSTLGDQAFYPLSGLTTLTVPASITSLGNLSLYIGDGTPNYPWNVTSIYIDNYATLNYIDPYVTIDGVFNQITQPTYYTSVDVYYKTYDTSSFSPSSLEIYNKALPAKSIVHFASVFTYTDATTSISFDSTITSSSYRSTGLATAIISSVTRIDANAFTNRTELSSVTILSPNTSIYSYAFNGCTGLTSVSIGSDPSILSSSVNYTLYDNIFFNCVNLSSVIYYIPMILSPTTDTSPQTITYAIDPLVYTLNIPRQIKYLYQNFPNTSGATIVTHTFNPSS
jgi:hypothetical protein